MRIGLRAHDYAQNVPVEQLAETLAPFHPDSIQLALGKAVKPPPPGGMTPGFARHVQDTLSARGIAVAVLGCYINPVHPDADAREAQLRRFEEHLRWARDFGAPLVGTETGSCNADCSPHPDTDKSATFGLLCRSIERLVNFAEKCGSAVAVEAVAGKHTISSIEKMRSLLDRFPSPALRVIYDPVNLIPLEGLPAGVSQEQFFRAAFDAFGNEIAAVHLKDFRIEKHTGKNEKIGDLPVREGELETETLLKLLAEKKPDIDILLENSVPAWVQPHLDWLRSRESSWGYHV